MDSCQKSVRIVYTKKVVDEEAGWMQISHMVTMEKKIQLQTFQIKLQDNMDLRIVNTCDSDCMYCLEQSLRKKQKFISRKEVFLLLQQYRNQTPDDTILAFY